MRKKEEEVTCPSCKKKKSGILSIDVAKEKKKAPLHLHEGIHLHEREKKKEGGGGLPPRRKSLLSRRKKERECVHPWERLVGKERQCAGWHGTPSCKGKGTDC